MTSHILPLPPHTPELFNVSLIHLADMDANKLDPHHALKLFFMMTDARFTKLDPAGLCEGEVVLFDFEGFNFRHLMKATTALYNVRVFLTYVQEAAPWTIRGIHILNCSTIVSKLFNFLRPFVKKELFEAIQFHTSGYDSLHQIIPKDILPEEYGGTCSSTEIIWKSWLQYLESQR